MVMLLKKCRLILSTYWTLDLLWVILLMVGSALQARGTLDLLWVIVLVAGSALQQGGLDFSCLSSLSGAGGCLTEAALVKAVEWVHAWMSFSCVQLFATPWAAACQASLSMGIFQARILEWVAMPSCRGSSQPRDQTQVSRIAGWWILSHQGRPRCSKSCQFNRCSKRANLARPPVHFEE